MHPTPLRVDKIIDILKAMSTRSPFRSIGAARVMGRPVGCSCRSRSATYCDMLITKHFSLHESRGSYALPTSRWETADYANSRLYSTYWRARLDNATLSRNDHSSGPRPDR